ncbi:unnamed protein product [Amoebophrya sp. A25]|nr:unnamed protein product [Amoebophrya sp. A25]|eukprot:GSA25T00019017001.1
MKMDDVDDGIDEPDDSLVPPGLFLDLDDVAPDVVAAVKEAACNAAGLAREEKGLRRAVFTETEAERAQRLKPEDPSWRIRNNWGTWKVSSPIWNAREDPRFEAQPKLPGRDVNFLLASGGHRSGQGQRGPPAPREEQLYEDYEDDSDHDHDDSGSESPTAYRRSTSYVKGLISRSQGGQQGAAAASRGARGSFDDEAHADDFGDRLPSMGRGIMSMQMDEESGFILPGLSPTAGAAAFSSASRGKASSSNNIDGDHEDSKSMLASGAITGSTSSGSFFKDIIAQGQQGPPMMLSNVKNSAATTSPSTIDPSDLWGETVEGELLERESWRNPDLFLGTENLFFQEQEEEPPSPRFRHFIQCLKMASTGAGGSSSATATSSSSTSTNLQSNGSTAIQKGSAEPDVQRILKQLVGGTRDRKGRWTLDIGEQKLFENCFRDIRSTTTRPLSLQRTRSGSHHLQHHHQPGGSVQHLLQNGGSAEELRRATMFDFTTAKSLYDDREARESQDMAQRYRRAAAGPGGEYARLREKLVASQIHGEKRVSHNPLARYCRGTLPHTAQPTLERRQFNRDIAWLGPVKILGAFGCGGGSSSSYSTTGAMMKGEARKKGSEDTLLPTEESSAGGTVRHEQEAGSHAKTSSSAHQPGTTSVAAPKVAGRAARTEEAGDCSLMQPDCETTLVEHSTPTPLIMPLRGMQYSLKALVETSSAGAPGQTASQRDAGGVRIEKVRASEPLPEVLGGETVRMPKGQKVKLLQTSVSRAPVQEVPVGQKGVYRDYLLIRRVPKVWSQKGGNSSSGRSTSNLFRSGGGGQRTPTGSIFKDANNTAAQNKGSSSSSSGGHGQHASSSLPSASTSSTTAPSPKRATSFVTSSGRHIDLAEADWQTARAQPEFVVPDRHWDRYVGTIVRDQESFRTGVVIEFGVQPMHARSRDQGEQTSAGVVVGSSSTTTTSAGGGPLAPGTTGTGTTSSGLAPSGTTAGTTSTSGTSRTSGTTGLSSGVVVLPSRGGLFPGTKKVLVPQPKILFNTGEVELGTATECIVQQEINLLTGEVTIVGRGALDPGFVLNNPRMLRQARTWYQYKIASDSKKFLVKVQPQLFLQPLRRLYLHQDQALEPVSAVARPADVAKTHSNSIAQAARRVMTRLEEFNIIGKVTSAHSTTDEQTRSSMVAWSRAAFGADVEPLLTSAMVLAFESNLTLQDWETKFHVNAEAACARQACVDAVFNLVRRGVAFLTTMRMSGFDERLRRALQAMEILEDYYIRRVAVSAEGLVPPTDAPLALSALGEDGTSSTRGFAGAGKVSKVSTTTAQLLASSGGNAWRLVPPAVFIVENMLQCPWVQAADYQLAIDAPEKWSFRVDRRGRLNGFQKVEKLQQDNETLCSALIGGKRLDRQALVRYFIEVKNQPRLVANKDASELLDMYMKMRGFTPAQKEAVRLQRELATRQRRDIAGPQKRVMYEECLNRWYWLHGVQQLKQACARGQERLRSKKADHFPMDDVHLEQEEEVIADLSSVVGGARGGGAKKPPKPANYTTTATSSASTALQKDYLTESTKRVQAELRAVLAHKHGAGLFAASDEEFSDDGASTEDEAAIHDEFMDELLDEGVEEIDSGDGVRVGISNAANAVVQKKPGGAGAGLLETSTKQGETSNTKITTTNLIVSTSSEEEPGGDLAGDASLVSGGGGNNNKGGNGASSTSKKNDLFVNKLQAQVSAGTGASGASSKVAQPPSKKAEDDDSDDDDDIMFNYRGRTTSAADDIRDLLNPVMAPTVLPQMHEAPSRLGAAGDDLSDSDSSSSSEVKDEKHRVMRVVVLAEKSTAGVNLDAMQMDGEQRQNRVIALYKYVFDENINAYLRERNEQQRKLFDKHFSDMRGSLSFLQNATAAARMYMKNKTKNAAEDSSGGDQQGCPASSGSDAETANVEHQGGSSDVGAPTVGAPSTGATTTGSSLASNKEPQYSKKNYYMASSIAARYAARSQNLRQARRFPAPLLDGGGFASASQARRSLWRDLEQPRWLGQPGDRTDWSIKEGKAAQHYNSEVRAQLLGSGQGGNDSGSFSGSGGFLSQNSGGSGLNRGLGNAGASFDSEFDDDRAVLDSPGDDMGASTGLLTAQSAGYVAVPGNSVGGLTGNHGGGGLTGAAGQSVGGGGGVLVNNPKRFRPLDSIDEVSEDASEGELDRDFYRKMRRR